MILTCPKCSMRYLVAGSAIGEAGRQVKCASCSHQWFQEPVEEEETPPPVEEASAEEPAAEEEVAEEAPQEEAAETEAEEPAAEEAETEEAPAEEPAEEAASEEVPAEDIPESLKPDEGDVPATSEDIEALEEQEAKRDKETVMGYAAAAGVLFVLLGLMFALKTPITGAWPASAAFYESLGSNVPVQGEGLIFDQLNAVASKDSHGEEQLKVTGRIVNLTDHEVAVPRMLAALRLKDGTETEQWMIDAPKGMIAGDGTMNFESLYPGVPEEVTSVNVRFAMNGKMKAMPKKEHVGGHKEASHDDTHGSDHAEPAHKEEHDAAHGTTDITEHHDEPEKHADEEHHEPAHDDHGGGHH